MRSVKRGVLATSKSNFLLFLSIGGFAAVFLWLFLASMLTSVPVFADNEPTASTDIPVDIDVQPVIAIRALDSAGTDTISSVPLNVYPVSSGAFAKNSFMIQVDTNNQTGYELFMSSDYKTDGTTSTTTPASQAAYTNSLVNVPANDSIATISTDVTESDFSANNSSYQNKWGVSKSWNETISGDSHTGGNLALYSPVPNHDTTITLRDDVETAAFNSRTDIGIAVNVNTEKISGSYRNKLVFTAVANEVPEPIVLPDFWNITTMQEMTPEVCASVYTPNNTISMTDEYIINKSRALAGDYTVTSDNSSPLVPEVTLLDDRDADGTGTKESYKVRKLADGNCWMVDALEYDLLALYNNGKRGIGSKNDGSTFEMTDSNLASGVGYYTTTANAYDYVINSNTKPLTNITRQSYLGDVTGQTEYYYNWTAATAGQGSQSDATDGVSVDGSICPAGWRLPTNYNDATNQNISWSALTNAYLGITGNASTTTGYQTLDQYPINLYRAGYVYSGNQDHAAYGIYWSSTANSASNGYRLSYYTSYVGPQYNANKNYGFPLRCVASR